MPLAVCRQAGNLGFNITFLMGFQNLNVLEELLSSVGLGENKKQNKPLKEREERKIKQLKNNNNNKRKQHESESTEGHRACAYARIEQNLITKRNNGKQG